MAAKDKFHLAARHALEKDGWTITHDPYVLNFLGKRQEADLGAEKAIAAEKDNQKILVEIKSFLSESPFSDYYEALGQYLSYQLGLNNIDPSREIWLAITIVTYKRLQVYGPIMAGFAEFKVNLLIFDPETEIIKLWQH
jgi:hypothetical protein